MKFPGWRSREKELKEEIENHLKMAAGDRVKRGASPDEARHAAHREFGNVDLVRATTREQWGRQWIDRLFQDSRYGLRILRKSPGFALAAILTLALGIGANSTIFSWIDATLLNPVPGAARTQQLVSVTLGPPTNPGPISYPNYLNLRDHNYSFSGLIAYSLRDVGLTGIGRPERIWGMLVSANYFDVLGVRPILGRGFLPSEGKKENGAPVVVINYGLWQRRFAGNPSVLGRSIEINRHSYTIVGVTPERFQGSQTGLSPDLWIPLSMTPQLVPGENILQSRGANWLMSQGRLKPGVTLEQAQADMTLLMQRLVHQFPTEHKAGNAMTLTPIWRDPFGANHFLSGILLLLMAIAGVVLLLACANVANLMLVRSISRRREIAIRLSIGASRAEIVRQFLVESLLLALGGGIVASLFTLWSEDLLPKFIPPTNLPIAIGVHFNLAVVWATVLLSILTCVIFGILPALRASGLEPVSILKEESGAAAGGVRKARLSSALVVIQMALSLLLLICSGLFIRSFRRAQHFDPGFNPHHVLLATYEFFDSRYDANTGIKFHEELLDKLRALPGVQSAALADWAPMRLQENRTDVAPEGYVPRTHESMEVSDASVSPDYFRTMRIPLAAGREFTANDRLKSAPVVVVNQAFAARYWPGQDALEKKVKIFGVWFGVIGVARNSNYQALNENAQAFVYLPFFQNYYPGGIIHLRVAGDPLAYASVVEKTVHQLNADLPVFGVTSLDSVIQLNTTTQRLAGTFVGGFGLLALLIAAVGIYGVIAYVTRQRTHEIGLRMALGANPRDIFSLVLRQGFFLALLGVFFGLAAALALTRALSSQLFGVTATDPLTFAMGTALLILVALLACYLPARRAMRVDPMVALRYE